MDSLGLPIAFGKATLPPKPSEPQAESSKLASTRGETSTRGSRGVVGGGKRKRGRGGSQIVSAEQQAADEEAARVNLISGTTVPLVIEGLTRQRASYTARQPLPPQESCEFGSQRAHQPPNQSIQRGRGGIRGGRLGGHDGRGGNGEYNGSGGGQSRDRGFYKESFAEDPWKEILKDRAMQRATSRP